jgi:hypothetical protein
MAWGKDNDLDKHDGYSDIGRVKKVVVLRDAGLYVEQVCGVVRELNKMLDTFQKQAWTIDEGRIGGTDVTFTL